MKRYRYILNGCVLGTDKISKYRLIAQNNIKPSYDGSSALRVNIPEGFQLEKCSCDSYSTTDDKRTLDELGYDMLIWNKSKRKWTIHNELKGIMPCDFRFNS